MTIMTARIQQIKQRLQDAFEPQKLIVIDESEKHVNHPGAKEGHGHFSIEIVSHHFRDKTPMERHRLIYQALGSLMQTDIHAVRINAKAK